MTTEVVRSRLVTTGNIEIDKKVGGGLPPGSLTLIEGQSDAGKSVLVQQFIWGSLQQGLRIALYTTENTTPTTAVKSLPRSATNVLMARFHIGYLTKKLYVAGFFLLRAEV